MKILFISRAFPPVIGGIENQNYELAKWLEKKAELKKIVNRHGKLFLPFFLPWAFLQSLFLIPKCEIILLGDGVLSVIGWLIKKISRKPVVCITHGLDLTYPNWLYQKLWVNFFLQRMDFLIAVGRETVEAGVNRGLQREKFCFIPNGINPQKYDSEGNRGDLEKILNRDLKEKKIILTVGRLVRRKGIAWFVKNVTPRLPENFLYVIAGEGPDRPNIEAAFQEKNLEKKVIILGRVSDETRNILFHNSHLFVQPNIKVKNDIEGFGIAVLEAGFCRLPVIASRLEGLQDSVVEGKNGFLVESGQPQEFVEKIRQLLDNEDFRSSFGEQARQFVEENFGWEKISEQYLDQLKNILSKRKN